MRADEDWRVRYEAACRAPPQDLAELAGDQDELVREMALSRLKDASIPERDDERRKEGPL
jgi:hypothetical protein